MLAGLGFGFASPKVVELMGMKPSTCVNHTIYYTPLPINLECMLTLVPIDQQPQGNMLGFQKLTIVG